MAFVRVCSVAEVPADEALAVDAGEYTLAIARDGDEVYDLHVVCSHAEVPLSKGEVEGCTVECWLHGSRFDLRTGKPTGLPATEPVATFPIEVRGDDVYVDVAETLNGVTPS